MCNFWVDWVLDNDPAPGKLRFAALQSTMGRALLERSGRRPDDISSIVLVTPDRALLKSDAVLEIGKTLSLTTPISALVKGVVPRAVADAAHLRRVDMPQTRRGDAAAVQRGYSAEKDHRRGRDVETSTRGRVAPTDMTPSPTTGTTSRAGGRTATPARRATRTGS